MQNINLIKIVKVAHEFIDKWLDYQVYINELPGLAVGISIENEIIFQKEYGYADIEAKKKFTNKHLFRIASHSKLFTATAIMMLYNEGKISLDDKVSKYLSWFTSEKDDNLQYITIRHLLTHTSGLSSDGKVDSNDKSVPNLDEIKKQLKEGLSSSKIDDDIKYSNIGYIILGQIIEAISKQTYAQFIQNRIFDTLKLTNSYIDVTEENKKLLPVGYGMKFPREDRERFSPYPEKVYQPAAGICCTMEDLIKFLQAHLYGNNILLQDDLKREMQRVQVKINNNIRGLGFGLSNFPEGKIALHMGGAPGYRSMSGLIQENKIIVSVFCNGLNVGIDGFFFSLCHLVETLFSLQDTLLQKTENSPDFSSLNGFYKGVGGWGPELFWQIGSKLVLLNPENKFPGGSMQILQHKERLVFTPSKESPSAKAGEDIEFIDDPNGSKIYLDSKKREHKRFEYSY